jgi:hypothetical protein
LLQSVRAGTAAGMLSSLGFTGSSHPQCASSAQ